MNVSLDFSFHLLRAATDALALSPDSPADRLRGVLTALDAVVVSGVGDPFAAESRRLVRRLAPLRGGRRGVRDSEVAAITRDVFALEAALRRRHGAPEALVPV
ncbi:MAG TPA: hypothetical protein VEI02_16610 [Planctomycetota bacterium]|nr:hypothetical protein [Planctomycetota bacterium]